MPTYNVSELSYREQNVDQVMSDITTQINGIADHRMRDCGTCLHTRTAKDPFMMIASKEVQIE